MNLYNISLTSWIKSHLLVSQGCLSLMGLCPDVYSFRNNLLIQKCFQKSKVRTVEPRNIPQKQNYTESPCSSAFYLAIPTPEARLGMLQLLRSANMVVLLFIPPGESSITTALPFPIGGLSRCIMGKRCFLCNLTPVTNHSYFDAGTVNSSLICPWIPTVSDMFCWRKSFTPLLPHFAMLQSFETHIRGSIQ